jgi:lipid II:glycine glycyltransferase (peptidoglycan interpeptide bridge formation enzyme)
MIYYRKKGPVQIAEIWYNNDGEFSSKKIDMLRYKFLKTKLDKAASAEELYTLVINLEQNEDDLYANIRKNTRYEINRAKEKDNIICDVFIEPGSNNNNKINEYIKYYNTFADSKGRNHIYFTEISHFYDAGTFSVRSAKKGDEYLTMHAYVISDDTARLFQSSSLFRTTDESAMRNMIGRANRLLHWEDILWFKRMGLTYYDFGGWYGGSETTGTYAEQLQINHFKESFGGEIKKEYSFYIPVTILGKAAFLCNAIVKKK